MSYKQSTKLITGDGRNITVAGIAKLYRDTVNLACPIGGQIHQIEKSTFRLEATFKATDCDTMKSVKLMKIYTTQLNEKEGTIESAQCISDLDRGPGGYLASVKSNNGQYVAVLRSVNDEKQFLEIWHRSRLLKTLDIDEIEGHGPINTDQQFSKMTWSTSGEQNKLMYVCHQKKPKAISFFKNSEKKDAEPEVGNEYNLKEDWGERLAGVEHSIVAILDAETLKITSIDEEGFSLGTPVWLDNSNKIASVGWAENPKRLGLTHCNNRSSEIFIHDWQQAKLVTKIGQKGKSFHTLRASNKGNNFLYLSNDIFGPHLHCVEIYLHDVISEKSQRCVTHNTSTDDLTEQNCISNKETFFIRNLPENCFTSDDNNILMITHNYLFQSICIYSIETKTLHTMNFPTLGVNILDFKKDIILAVGSDINTTPTLFVAKLNLADTNDILPWHQLNNCHHLDDVSYDTYLFPALDDKSKMISTILISPVLPKEIKSIPTIILPHGGPHSCFQVEYSNMLILFTRLGLRTLLINYRGSTGVDDAYNKSLCGNVGTMDIEDVLQAIRFAADKKLIQTDKLILFGGSHGGFLACHLSCQEEFKFTSAIIRNPVVDIASMFSVTDIPDWTVTEALNVEKFDFQSIPSSEELTKMFECSPSSRVQKANVPTLMMLGTKDRRVPMSQGLKWYEMLKARGIKTECKVYEAGHDLSEIPKVGADSFVNSSIWMLSHI